ncbi:AAA family ATPase [Pelistega suis]|uniref:AAA family ATPase n=1 Tax=Pelistega suis TaxID=1631957 RepID=UPI00211B8864|nr:AAA family ATPase [Pelistega suis]MCQ9328428.1 zeta toxin family protein [Pelistega suis]
MVVRNNHSKCIILAGVNGAGKSTLFDVYLKEYDLEFVNADVIAKSLTLPKDSYAASVRAGKIALTTLREFINNKVSFIFETTLTSHQSSNSNECSG